MQLIAHIFILNGEGMGLGLIVHKYFCSTKIIKYYMRLVIFVPGNKLRYHAVGIGEWVMVFLVSFIKHEHLFFYW